MAELTGTGRLAAGLCLIAHHEVSGRPLLQPRAAGLGMTLGSLAVTDATARRLALAIIGPQSSGGWA